MPELSNSYFTVYRGEDEKIKALGLKDGAVYFAIDTNKIYFDEDLEGTGEVVRHCISGGGGASFLSAHVSDLQKTEDAQYEIPLDSIELEDGASVNIDDIVIDDDDRIYRIKEIADGIAYASMVSGGGAGGSDTRALTMAAYRNPDTGVNMGIGQQYIVTQPIRATYLVTPNTRADVGADLTVHVKVNDVALGPCGAVDARVSSPFTITIPADTLVAGLNTIQIDAEVNGLYANVQKVMDIDQGIEILKHGLTHTVTGYAVTFNAATMWNERQQFQLTENFSFNYAYNNVLSTASGVKGRVAVYIDDESGLPVAEDREVYKAQSDISIEATVMAERGLTHGAHTLIVKGYVTIGGTEFLVNTLKYNIMLIDPESNEPIIISPYNATEELNFSLITIPLMVYQKGIAAPRVRFYVNGKPSGAAVNVPSSTLEYYNWIVTDYDYKINETHMNTFQVFCGDTVNRLWNVTIVQTDETKELEPVEDESLQVNLTAIGRSNNETTKMREKWQYGEYSAILKDFNWYNNGWGVDSDGIGYLRLSNGASVELPIPLLTTQNAPENGMTVEIEFKPHDVVNYARLVREVMERDTNAEGVYVYDTNGSIVYTLATSAIDDEILNVPNDPEDPEAGVTRIRYKLVGTAKTYTLLTNMTGDRGDVRTIGETVYGYDGETWHQLGEKQEVLVKKASTRQGVIARYMQADGIGAGFCLGTQEAFFKTAGDNLTNVRYTEDTKVKVSFVVDVLGKADGRPHGIIYAYLNGVVSGAIRFTDENFKANASSLLFNSEFCDVDIYRIKIYNRSLDYGEIVRNWVGDAFNLYTKLARNRVNNGIRVYDEKKDPTIGYEEVKESGLLPIMVVTRYPDKLLSTPDNIVYEELPFVKTDEGKRVVDCRFYDPIHPERSFRAQRIGIQVQGTSSQGYPRRNYKIKLKDQDNKIAYKDNFLKKADGSQLECPFKFLTWDGDESVIKNNNWSGTKMVDKKGKAKLDIGTGIGETSFTLKADYMDSSSCHNTGLANLVQYFSTKDLTGENLGGFDFRHPLVRNGVMKYAEGVDSQSPRTTVMGFPYLMFEEKKGVDEAPRFLGKYNFNVDKGDTDTFGFTNDAVNPYTTEEIRPKYKSGHEVARKPDEYQSYYLDGNGQHNEYYQEKEDAVRLAAALKKYKEDNAEALEENPVPDETLTELILGDENLLHAADSAVAVEMLSWWGGLYYPRKGTYAEVCECWEMRDNQGTYTSFLVEDNTRPAVDADEAAAKAADPNHQLTFSQYGDYARQKHPGFYALNGDNELEIYRAYEARYLQADFDIDEDFYENTDWGKTEKSNRELAGYSKNFANFYSWLNSTAATQATNEPLATPYWAPTRDAEWITGKKYYVNERDRTDYWMYEADETPSTIRIDGENYESDLFAKFFHYTADIDNPDTVIGLEITTYKRYYKRVMGTKIVNGETVPVETYVARYEKNVYSCPTLRWDEDNMTPQFDKYNSADPGPLPSVASYVELFTTDSSEYRLSKFKKEFSKHLDLSYCLLYYILTNVLIMFDSRAKNMMIATWGPEEEGGDYIWYPIFYDMDTQLGVNNSGVVYWDYHNDPEEQGLFSGASSVLWTNINAVFQTEAQTLYRLMREKGYLSENVLNSYYNINLANQWSEIMKNADAFYKYIAPCLSVANGYGYMTKEGNMKGDDFTYLYCLQGDRTLNRTTFFKNRLNYKDSEWFAGVYNSSSGQGGEAVQIRYNANTTLGTSDPTLGTPALQPGDAGYELESDLNFNVSTYVTQFCTVFYDEVPVRPSVKFDANDVIDHVTIPPIPSVASAIQNGVELPQQLVYFYGPKYIRSFGDLSNKYPDELFLQSATRIRDLRIGSDNPQYKNERLIKPEALGVASGATTPDTAKTLLQYIDISNLKLISGSLDITGCTKLQTLKALGTKLGQISLPAGAVYETVYLPNTTTSIVLRQPLELKRVLHTREPATYAARIRNQGDEITGLYIENLSDRIALSDAGIYSITEMEETATPIQTFVIDKTQLGYEDYMLLKYVMDSLIAARDRGGASATHELVMAAQNINWSSYRKLETDDDSGNAQTQYYYKTDVGTYAPYTYTNFINWQRDLTVVGLYVLEDPVVYEPLPLNTVYDSSKQYYSLIDGEYVLATNVNAENIGTQIWYKKILAKNPITSLAGSIFAPLLVEVGRPDLFKDAVNQAVGSTSSPVISGRVHFNNTQETALDEYEIYANMNSVWPDLEITANYITECERTKFVEIDPAGATILYSAQKCRMADAATTNVQTPVYTEELEPPTRQHYDFLGWSADPSLVETHGVVANANQVEIVFDAQGRHYSEQGLLTPVKFSDAAEVYYAVFCLHKYEVNFVMNSNWTETLYIVSGDYVRLPEAMPYQPADELARNNFWHFKGYGRYAEADTIIDDAILTRTIVNSNMTFYAKYEEKNIYDYPLDAKYYTLTPSGLTDETGAMAGLRIAVKPTAQLKGKVCIPKEGMYNGKSYPITHLWGDTNFDRVYDAEIGHSVYKTGQNGLAGNKDVTAIFFEGANDGTAKIQVIMSLACAAMFNLTYIDLPSSIILIDTQAFVNSHNLVVTEVNAETIGSFAFSGTNLYGRGQTLTINGQISYLGQSAFMEAGYRVVNIGSASHKATFSTAAGAAGGYANLGEGNAIFGAGTDRYEWTTGMPNPLDDAQVVATETVNFYTTTFRDPSQLMYIVQNQRVGATPPTVTIL